MTQFPGLWTGNGQEVMPSNPATGNPANPKHLSMLSGIIITDPIQTRHPENLDAVSRRGGRSEGGSYRDQQTRPAGVILLPVFFIFGVLASGARQLAVALRPWLRLMCAGALIFVGTKASLEWDTRQCWFW